MSCVPDRDFLSLRFYLTIEVWEEEEDKGSNEDAFPTSTLGVSLKYEPGSTRPKPDSLKLNVAEAVDGMSDRDLEQLTGQCRDIFYSKSLPLSLIHI